MAIYAQIIDKGSSEPRPLRWGWWHLNLIFDVLDTEGADPDHAEHIVLNHYLFTDQSDGEVLELHPGDTLRVWRNR